MDKLVERAIGLLHWGEYTFIGQDNAIFKGSLAQASEEAIVTQLIILAVEEIKGELEKEWLEVTLAHKLEGIAEKSEGKHYLYYKRSAQSIVRLFKNSLGNPSGKDMGCK